MVPHSGPWSLHSALQKLASHYAEYGPRVALLAMALGSWCFGRLSRLTESCAAPPLPPPADLSFMRAAWSLAGWGLMSQSGGQYMQFRGWGRYMQRWASGGPLGCYVVELGERCTALVTLVACQPATPCLPC
jgi:hypothetical protein